MKRRSFLRASSLATGPLIVAPSVLGLGDKVAPSSRVNLACIGVGNMGTGNLRAFLRDDRVQVVAICDVDQAHRERGVATAKLGPDAGYGDYREVVARDDVDAVMVATPDHWHSLVTAAAVKAGMDVYCEKPLAASIGEGRFVSDLVRKQKCVLQCGTWRRSRAHVRLACEWVRNGYIGDLKKIEVGVPGKFRVRGGYTGLEEPQPVPPGFDYEFWQGSAPRAPYTAARCHHNFRWVDTYAPGYITDWGVHFIDVAQWGNDTDDTGPVEISASEVARRDKGIYDAPESFEIRYAYANGVEMTMFSTTDKKEWGTNFIGTEGWVFTENERLETSPASLRTTKLKDDELQLYVSKDHHRNFIDCIHSRERTAAPVEAAHRAASACQLGAIAAATGRELNYDPARECFVNDPAADALLMREFHGGWELA